MKIMARYLSNGSLHILLICGEKFFDLYLHPMEQEDRRHMAMQLRVARKLLRRAQPAGQIEMKGV